MKRLTGFVRGVIVLSPSLALFGIREPTAGVVIVALVVVFAAAVVSVAAILLVLNDEASNLAALRAIAIALALLIPSFSLLHWAASQVIHCCFDEEMSKWSALYFVVTSITTTGFGDIAPRSDFCRIIVTVQMIVGLGVVALGLAGIVGRRDAG